MRKDRTMAGRMTDEQRKQIAEDYLKGETMKQIGNRLNISGSFVKNSLLKNGISPRSKKEAVKRTPPETKRKAIGLYKTGMTTTEVALKLGLHQSTVWDFVKEVGINRGIRESKKTYTIDETVFSNLNPESEYWLGFLITDGCLSISRNKSPILSLHLQHKDIGQIKSFRKFLGSNHPITDKTPDNKCKKSYHSGRYARVTFRCGWTIANNLIRHGVTSNKTFTAVAMGKLPKSIHFWRGAIDGDGSIFITKKNKNQNEIPVISFCSSSREFAKQFIAFVRKQIPNFCGTLKQDQREDFHSFSVGLSGANAIKLIRILYADGFALERKKELAGAIIKRADADPLWCNRSSSPTIGWLRKRELSRGPRNREITGIGE